ncbi:MAG: 3-deoxy-D-manno-octulosonic acid transferase [Verrucomicrobia bacterium]|nr:3-deoxy-D-manno-octulosonic acid transferase [Verrucomicrobiota bacterium]
MIWIYRLLFIPGFILSIPYLLWHINRRGGYGRDILQRIGKFPTAEAKDPKKKRVWIQAVSVGEVRALHSLLTSLTENPNLEVILTTATSTGYKIAKDLYSEVVTDVFYFPFDFVLFNRKGWKRIQPDLCILTEGELWPEHIYQAKKRKVPIVLINARISDRSFRYYQRFGSLARRLFRNLNRIVASSEWDAKRFRDLGCAPEDISCSGNLKCDVPLPTLLSESDQNELLNELGLPTKQTTLAHSLILCGASTWPGEEITLFRICQKLRKEGIDLRLLITPRHEERRNDIRSDLMNFSFNYHFRTEGPASQDVEVSIADTTGELTQFLQLSDIVFVGRSLPPHDGGQTPVEAGMLRKPILFGPGMSNFRQISKSLLEFGVAEQVADETALEDAIRKLCLQPELRLQQGEKADQWLQANQGATERTLKVLKNYLS